jgi:predicted permease
MIARRLLALLHAVLPRSVRDGLIGDLAELHAERAVRAGTLRADAWLVGQTATALVRYVFGPTNHHDRRWMMNDILLALRSSFRRAARRPGHASAVVATMGLGLGATTLAYTLVDGVLLTPLPYPDADRIVSVSEDNPTIRMSVGWSSLPNYRDLRDQARGFDGLAIFRGRSISIGTDAEPLYAYGALVSSEFFDVFGVTPELGRAFTLEEASVGGPPVAVLSHETWMRGYGGDPGILGRTVDVDGRAHTVVGVMPAGFAAPAEWVGLGPEIGMALWRPFPVDDDDARENRSYIAVGRLSDGVDLAAARAEVERVHGNLRAVYPDANAEWVPQVYRWAAVVVGPASAALWVLLGTMVLVLAVAGANAVGLAANGILARMREFATRIALGASRRSLVGQVLCDIGVLVTLAGVVGVGGAYGALHAIQALDTGMVPRLGTVRLDGSVLLFTLALIAVTALTVGLVASAYTLRADPAVRLGGGARGGGERGDSKLRTALSVVQLAMSFALLWGAVTMTRSFQNMHRAPLGFDPEGVTAMTIALSWERVGSLEERSRSTGEILDALRALPGVTSAGMINSLPLSGSRQVQRVEIDGVTEPGREPALAMRGASPGYVETMRIPVISGRAFETRDITDPSVALVNEAAARLHWPEGSPLGASVRTAGDGPWYTVVGVVGDVLYDGPRGEVLPEVYFPYSVETLTSKSFVVSSALPPAALAASLRDALRRVDPDQPVREIRSMGDWVARVLAPARFQSALMAGAAFMAVALAGIGLFASLASLVSERRRDIAVRVALGAGKSGVAWMVARRAGALIAPGIVAGVLLSLGLGRALQGFLFGVSPGDLITMAAVTVGVLLVGTLAATIPAARAVGVHPAQVLRED